MSDVSKGKGHPATGQVAQGVPGTLRPRIFLTFRHYKGGRSSAKLTGRLYPRRNPWYSLSEPYSMRVESGLWSALHLLTERLFTEGDDTRGCGDTIGPPDDEQRAARNMLRSVT